MWLSKILFDSYFALYIICILFILTLLAGPGERIARMELAGEFLLHPE